MQRFLCLILFALALAAVTPASGQTETPASLRQQIGQLERENETLRAELEDVQARFEALRREVESLRRALASTKGPSLQTETTTTPDGPLSAVGRASPLSFSREPLASPDSLFVSLVLDYREQLGEVSIDDSADTARRRVRGWTKTVGERFSGQTEWLTSVQLLNSQADRARHMVLVTILDPATLDAIQAPLPLEMPEKFSTRVEKTLETPGEAQGEKNGPPLWKLRVRMDALPRFDPDRVAPGPFNYPPYIGPFAGFAYSVQILGVGPITPDEVKRAFPIDEPDEARKVHR